jgi:hypothetical protein
MSTPKKTITTEIDEYGNFVTDFSGFQGDLCMSEEERFRRELEALGLVVRPKGSTRHQNVAPNTHTVRPAGGRLTSL